jgi:phytoene dehydrogenase-like protein
MAALDTDVAIIGAGHNGLVCAAYLAAAGLRVTLFERRPVAGGAAFTQEFHPGFRNSVAAYTVSLLNPTVIRDLELARHGLRMVERPIANFLPFPDGRYLKLGGGNTAREAAKFSMRDAERYAGYSARIDAVAELLRELMLVTPPNVTQGSWLEALPEMLRAGSLGRRLARFDLPMRRELLALFVRSVGDYLEDWFESPQLQAALGFDGVVGHFTTPYAPGTAYVLLHHGFGELNGKKGVWGHAIGGMGAIADAMLACAQSRGAQVRLSTPVHEVLVEDGRACGVRTDAGVFRARCVVSNTHPKILYQQLIDQRLLDAPFREQIGRYQSASGSFRMNVALSELPDFTALPGRAPAEHHGAGIVMAPSLGYMDEAFQDARKFGWSRQPIVELLISSVLDDTLAPPGQHVASLFCQHVAPTLPDGSSWDERREQVADHMIELVDQYAPNFKASVLGRQVLSPLDLERDFGLIGGDIFHGCLTLDQLFSARPMLGHGDYRGPLRGLYMCGAGTHPGGGVSGAPGHNAAREILRDLKRRKFG